MLMKFIWWEMGIKSEGDNDEIEDITELTSSVSISSVSISSVELGLSIGWPKIKNSIGYYILHNKCDRVELKQSCNSKKNVN